MSDKHDLTAWTSGADTIDGIAAEFAAAARSLVERTTNVSAIGSDQGNSTADDAVCIILPAAAAVLEEVIAGLEKGLKGEGTLMRYTADEIRQTEQDNVDVAKGAV